MAKADLISLNGHFTQNAYSSCNDGKVHAFALIDRSAHVCFPNEIDVMSRLEVDHVY